MSSFKAAKLESSVLHFTTAVLYVIVELLELKLTLGKAIHVDNDWGKVERENHYTFPSVLL